MQVYASGGASIEAIPHLREIQESAPSKLSDEIKKFFRTGHVRAALVFLHKGRS